MTMSYKTVLCESEAEVTEKKSRFIGVLIPIKSEEEAKEIWQTHKKLHHQANHVCYAYRLEGSLVIERYSDDGEPQGTAGMPMLEVLRGQGLENVLALVVRYFGGTKLGTGGLVRAYTAATQSVITVAEIVEILDVVPLAVSVTYNLSGKLEHYFKEQSLYIEDTLYDSGVTFKLLVELSELDLVEKALIERTAGQAICMKEKSISAYKRADVIHRLDEK